MAQGGRVSANPHLHPASGLIQTGLLRSCSWLVRCWCSRPDRRLLRRAIREISDAWEDFREEHERLIDVGDKVLAFQTIAGRGRAGGVGVRAPGAPIWTLRDGQVVHVEVFTIRPKPSKPWGWPHKSDRRLENRRVRPVDRVRLEKRARRAGVFVGRSTKAGFAQIKFLGPVLSALSFAFGISAVSFLSGVLGGSAALVVAVVVVCVSAVMLTGAYRLWDSLQSEKEQTARSRSFASSVTRQEPPLNDPRPDWSASTSLVPTPIERSTSRAPKAASRTRCGLFARTNGLTVTTCRSGFDGDRRGTVGVCWSRHSRRSRWWLNPRMRFWATSRSRSIGPSEANGLTST